MRVLAPAVLIAVLAGTALAQPSRRPGSSGPDDLSTGWQFAAGSPTEGLTVPTSSTPASRTAVSLPHRVDAPNTPLWYVRDIDLPRGAQLEINADDGAQVFVGRRLLPQQRRWYRVPPDVGGLQQVTVRVLNNAMSGGLRRVIVHGPTEAPPSVAGAPKLADAVPHPESAAFRARMPGPDAPCRFTAWADSQGGWATFDTITTRMLANRMDLSVGVGNLVNDGADPTAWQGLGTALRRLAPHAAIVPVVGNHDYDGFANDLLPALYLQVFDPPEGRTYTAWSCGPVRFVAIDINASFPVGVPRKSAQQVWLDREVQGREWRAAARGCRPDK